LRKYKGRLVPTARGRDLAGDPVGLWWHLARALPVGGRDVSDPEWQAGVLLLALMASGSTDNAELTIAKLLTGLGWAVGDGQPIDRRTVTGLIAADVHLLRQLGAFERDRRSGWPGAVTSDGIALARAALGPPK
ncbi:MAG: plasmid pRiA4b ORF-3 family protein, partial [Nitriliruptor sp.]